MQKINPIYLLDSYKVGHALHYPKGTTCVFSNLTPRSNKWLPQANRVTLFGLQYFIKEYLIDAFNKEFFDRPKEEVCREYQELIDYHLGTSTIDTSHIAALHDLQYLPIAIHAIPEGQSVRINEPMLTIYNTEPTFYWLTNYLETVMSAALWMPCTTATKSKLFREKLEKYADETCDNNSLVDFQGHDFSFRGMSSVESAIVSGAAHLINFKGTDVIPSLQFVKNYYGGKLAEGFSVSATEHSASCLATAKEGEFNFFKRLINETHPQGILSIVSDTYDYFGVLTKFLPLLKDDIIARFNKGQENGVFSKVVIRPDSGRPEYIINGDINGETEAEKKGSLNILAEIFGCTFNSRGYRELHPAIGLIQGEGITLDNQETILDGMKQNGFASNNLVFGVGSYLYQYNSRDSLGFAIKATYGEVRVDGAHGRGTQKFNIFKDPVTDKGKLKKSHKGLLAYDADGNLQQECTWDQVENCSRMNKVFENGFLLRPITFAEVRENAK
jgi:nicotinamide phosphoribosyltransferase